MYDLTAIATYMDTEGRVRVLPSRRNKNKERELIYLYVAEQFQTGVLYTEKEVNDIINRVHTFGDHALLRRELVEHRYLARTRSGSEYWRVEQ